MENTTKCPQCLMPVNKDDEKCPSCGSPLKGKKCPDCATFVAEGTDVCPTCGHQFNDESASLPVPPEELDGIIQKWKSQNKLAAFFSMNKLFSFVNVISMIALCLVIFLIFPYLVGEMNYAEALKVYEDHISFSKTMILIGIIGMGIGTTISLFKYHYQYISLSKYAKESALDVKSVISGALSVKLDGLTSKQKKSFSENIRLLISAAAYIDDPEQTSKNNTYAIISAIGNIVSAFLLGYFLITFIEEFIPFYAFVKPIFKSASLIDVVDTWWVLITAVVIGIVAVIFKPKYPIEAEWVKKNLPNKVQAFANLPIIKKK